MYKQWQSKEELHNEVFTSYKQSKMSVFGVQCSLKERRQKRLLPPFASDIHGELLVNQCANFSRRVARLSAGRIPNVSL